VNNTIVQASDGRWALNIQNGSTGNTVYNNILYNNHPWRGSIDISQGSLAGFVSDHNVAMERFTTNGGNSVSTLVQWRTATGQDQHSLVATPAVLFVDVGSHDFHLSATSPALNAGTVLQAPGVDFEGDGRPSGGAFDIGADERPESSGENGSFQLSSATYSVNEGSGSISITVIRVGGAAGAATVNYGTSDGTASSHSDYLATSGTLSFASGETSKSFTIPITNDSSVESNESLNVTLSGPTGGAVLGSPSTATVTIVDNDASAGVLQFSSATYSVGEGTRWATITVRRTGGSAGKVKVNYRTSNGTASAGSDYLSTSGTLTFADGETTKTFRIRIREDRRVEGSESIVLILSNPTGGAVLGSGKQATLNIADNDS
jgi:hypothetical protein